MINTLGLFIAVSSFMAESIGLKKPANPPGLYQKKEIFREVAESSISIAFEFVYQRVILNRDSEDLAKLLTKEKDDVHLLSQ